MMMHRRAALITIALIATAACESTDDTTCTGAACRLGGNPGAPTFAGARTASPDRTGTRARITWAAASDDKTAPEALRYRVFVSTHQGHALANEPIATSEPGATSISINIAPANATHYVVVRALDTDNNEDGNAIEKTVVASPDVTPPSFAGLKAAVPAPGSGLTLSWDPASDDRTAPEAIRYVVLDATRGEPLAVVNGDGVNATTEVTLHALGAAGEKKSLLVHAIDAADNVDSNQMIIEATLGADTTPPTFAGCHAEPLGSQRIRVSWAAATDDATPPAQMKYEIFVANAAGAEAYASPPSANATGSDSSIVIEKLTAGTTYYVVCRARDAAGNSDTNTAETSAKTSDNIAPPTFAGGVASIDPVTRNGSISWTAATDDKTPPSKIVYVVYEAHGIEPFDYTKKPRLVTDPGVPNVQLTGLASHTLYRFVVRARDEDFNEDANTAESSGQTNTSFAADVIPLFAQNCAVVGCHIAPISMGGMSLSAFNAYDQIVDVTAGQKPLLKRIAPMDSANSYLYQKVLGQPGITGNPMPAPGTGNILSIDQKDIIKTWIDQGAVRN